MSVSSYRAIDNEANFGKPITTQVAGGTHITFEMITHAGGRFFATRWPKGLPGHDDPPNTLRFPHGLIRFGESLEMCAARLVRGQLGMSVKGVEIAYWDSYVDKDGHWHIEPGCLVEVTGQHKVPRGASEIVTFTLENVPDLTFWTGDDLREAVGPELSASEGE